jgi:XTP/dITP diphosphohydrolase
VSKRSTHALVVATNNRGKLEELRALLEGLPIEMLTLADVGAAGLTIVEDGATFEENAVKKARTVAEATTMLTIADDSGLEVDALGGLPGVRSARFAHERATDAENNATLLTRLEELDPPQSGHFPARFRCVLALVDPYGAEPFLSEGRCEGAITRTPRGGGGFGYDPLFVVEGGDKTMAELASEEKNRISHRALACLRMRPILDRLLVERDETIRKILG